MACVAGPGQSSQVLADSVATVLRKVKEAASLLFS